MKKNQDLSELEPLELEKTVVNLGGRPFNARQILKWIYQQNVTDFTLMTDLPVNLRNTLAHEFTISTPTTLRPYLSQDGTAKLLLQLNDNKQVEAVFIPFTPRMTFCVSTQVGCAMQCDFCLTGQMGLSRNLTAGEIVGQVRVMADRFNLTGSSLNVVLMGMGEPLHNYDATIKAIRILNNKNGLAIPSRRITLSTVGLIPEMERLASESIMPNLAVSLHATTQELRDRLVPINRKYSLTDLLSVCRQFPTQRRRRITFEYVLLADTNDSMDDVKRLASLLDGMQAKVNVIPLNESPSIPYRRPSDERINKFSRALAQRGITVMVRKSRGRDISAACGQLIVEKLPSSAK